MSNNSRTKAKQQSYAERQVNKRTPLPLFLIVCEGEKTEPNYFKCFRISTLKVKVVGLGDNTLSLVHKAIELKNEGEYECVWCVFDRDSFPADKFNSAIILAFSNNIHVAYTNEAFELWYLLHFHFYCNGMSRKEYQRKLTSHLGYPYKKNSETIYEKLKDKQSVAIKHADALQAQYETHNPERDNPSTTVHILVKQLNDLASNRAEEFDPAELHFLLNVCST